MPKTKKISFGGHLVNTWNDAPYPEEYTQSPVLYLCEFCIKYMKSEDVANRHKKECNVRHPPGDEIYRDGKISIFEVDGRKSKMYCTNLSLLSMLFLKDKVVYEEVEPFLFYVMTECDERGYHFIDYFSKEKCSELNNNLACITTMPMYQRKGYGQFLIDFSYLQSQKENKCGSPERPLSNLGQLSYRSYWKRKVFQMLEKHDGTMTIEDMSAESKMTEDDITAALEFSQLLSYKKRHSSMLRVDKIVIKEYMEEYHSKGHMVLKPEMLQWTPVDYSTIDDQ